MSLITLDEAKRQCRIELEFTDDDVVLQAFIDAAEDHASTYTGRAFFTDQAALTAALAAVPPTATEDDMVIRPAIRAAMLLHISHLYENRALADPLTLKDVPMSYDALLGPHRILRVG